MKKLIKYIIIIGLIIGALIGLTLFTPTVNAPADGYLYIKSGATLSDVKKSLQEKQICNSIIFGTYARLFHYEQHIRSGKYAIDNHSTLFSLLRKLISGQQTEVRLVINKLRTKEDFARLISEKLEPSYTEALTFLTSNDSLKSYSLDTNTVMTAVIPNSYLYWWNGSMRKIFERLKRQHDYFWERRNENTKAIGFSPEEVYTIASIVEEETNRDADKGKVASVYINRLHKGMKLEADPTVKYAMRDFELKRIMHIHLGFPSAYNTYQHTGLPPGPICTPSITTIDAVLHAPKTDYLFFVAKPDFKGYSNFASTYSEHLKYAAAYQKALDVLMQKSK